jgi:hypothetical protein
MIWISLTSIFPFLLCFLLVSLSILFLNILFFDFGIVFFKFFSHCFNFVINFFFSFGSIVDSSNWFDAYWKNDVWEIVVEIIFVVALVSWVLSLNETEIWWDHSERI